MARTRSPGLFIAGDAKRARPGGASDLTTAEEMMLESARNISAGNEWKDRARVQA
jgi:hypothetical protein